MSKKSCPILRNFKRYLYNMLFLSGRQIDFTVVNASETKNKITNYTLKKNRKLITSELWQNNVKKYHNGSYVIVSFITMYGTHFFLLLILSHN